jgi:hypothetical protein
MIGGVSLHQFAESCSPRPPNEDVFDRLRLALPQSSFDHPSTQRLLANLDLMPFGQLLSSEGRTEIVLIGALQDR